MTRPSSTKIPGRKVACLGGFSAFVPAPLPPELEWTPNLVRALSDADRLIGRLAGEGGSLPNPHVLMRPFVQREAVLSSRIEGTQATLGELLAAEAGAAVERSPDDLREVGNYVVALEHGIERLKKLPLCVRLVRELHEKLMTGVRGDSAKPGEFRRIQNWIGRPGSTPATASFVPPPPDDVEPCLAQWEKFIHEQTLPPLVQVAMAHYQFEAIHPFLDGNGRVGRLLITLFLVERRILPTPLLYLSAFFEATRRDYYGGLRAISEQGAWDEWLEYFLNGVARMSEDALGRAARINALLSNWRVAAAGGGTNTPMLLLDLVAANPFVTVNHVAEKLDVAFTTAQRAIIKLEKLKIISEVSKAKRDRVYCAKAIFEILEEPAHLIPSGEF
ncbi:MAG: Fic family protein [Verrucomicrobiales bacterium]|nr:Fic family protein [Verrucomicrobiales bacterium]